MTATVTVSSMSIVMMAVSACLSLFFPLGLYLALRKGMGMRFLPLVLGAVVFAIFALGLERLAIGGLFRIEAVKRFLTSQGWIYALFGGLAAGLFEETGRLCAFLFLLRRRNNGFGCAFSYGIGHGGGEALILAFLPMIGNIIAAVMVNTAGAGAVLGLAPGQEGVVSQILESIAETPPTIFLASGLERITAVCFHIAASVLVWMAVSGRGPGGLFFLAVLAHMAVNFPAGLYQSGVLTGIWLVEGITAVLVLLVCIAAYIVYDKCSQNYTSLLHYNPADFGI